MEERQERGRLLAQDKRIKHIDGALWMVPSQTQNAGGYLVNMSAGTCSCPDFELRQTRCKHLWALVIVTSKTDGSQTETVKVIKRTYSQSWTAYNGAQCSEKETVQKLLRGLCDGIVTPPHPGRGPKPIPLSDMVYAMTMKVYTTMSGRRATTDIQACIEAGHIKRRPHYNSLFNYFEKPEMTSLLTALIEDSATPLKDVESDFAADSTGFGTKVYRRWYDQKYGREMKEQTWVKAHAMVGVITNIVTSVTVTESNAHDSPELPALVETTSRQFNIKEISGDKAYLSHANLAIIERVKAVPYIPFKSNSKGEGSDAWRRLWGIFMYKHDEFLSCYHKRSNVESTFSAIKRLFGGSVRSKTFTAQVNEVLCKILCYNLSVLVHEMYKLGISPSFHKSTEIQ